MGPIFTVLKDPNLLEECTKNHEASYNFRLRFDLSNRPHFTSVRFIGDITVYVSYNIATTQEPLLMAQVW